MKLLFTILLVTMFIAGYSADPTTLSQDDIVNHYWKFYNDNGYVGLIRF